MRVIVTPCAETAGDTLASELARAIAGPDGEVLSQSVAALAAPSRPLTPAEVHLIREALLGGGPPGRGGTADPMKPVVGYVCAGRRVSASTAHGVEGRTTGV